MVEKRLGRGLDFLISKDASLEGDEIIEIEIGRIQPNRYQPRKEFKDEALSELKDSIQRHGYLQPLIVRPSGSGYELVAGERRWRAGKALGLDTVPAVVKSVDDDRLLELALVENLQREDLDPIEKAKACRSLMQQATLTHEEVAKRLGKNRSTVSNFLRLLDLPQTIQDLVHEGALAMGHARALLGFSSPGDQLRLAERIVREGLSVRRVEELVGQETRRTEPRVRSRPEKPPHIAALETTLEAALGTRVRVELARGRQDRGKLTIEFFSEEDFQKLLALLAPQRPDLP